MRILLAALLLLFATGAIAQLTPGASNFNRICPGGGALCNRVPLTPTRSFSFMGSIPSGFTFTRSSTGWYFNSSGNLTSASNNTPRFDYGSPGSGTLNGILIEPTATNKLIYSRDLTQTSVWTPTNATTALDQMGIDGVSNSASSITATSSSASVCQPITQAATSSVFSVYLKRVSGVGTISISQDGGTTSTTTVLSGSWQRFQHAAQSTLNPTMCIQIATNGDEIAVDVAQFEATAYYSSPIITNSIAVTRTQDNLSTNPTWYNLGSGTYVFEWKQQEIGGGIIGGFGSGSYGPFGSQFGLHWNGGNFENPVDGQHCGTPSLSTVNKAGATYGSKLYEAATNSTLCSRSNSVNSTKPNFFGFTVGGPMWMRAFTYWNYPVTIPQLQSLTSR